MSNMKAWRVAKTTSGEPDFDSFADITLMVPGIKNIHTIKIQGDRAKAYKNLLAKQNQLPS